MMHDEKPLMGSGIIIFLLMVILAFSGMTRWFLNAKGRLKPGQEFPQIELQKPGGFVLIFPDNNENLKIVYIYKFRCSKCRRYLAKLLTSQNESSKKFLEKHLILISVDNENYWKIYSSKLKVNCLIGWDYKHEIAKILIENFKIHEFMNNNYEN